MSRRLCSVIVVGAVLLISQTSEAAPPALNVDVHGLELLPQSIFGAALFIFEVQGDVDGRQRRGLGLIAINHESPLPAVEGESVLITGGAGTILVGLTLYKVDVNSGSLTLTDDKDSAKFDDAFAVRLDAIISRAKQSADHTFLGVLDHGPFPPTIKGELGVTP